MRGMIKGARFEEPDKFSNMNLQFKISIDGTEIKKTAKVKNKTPTWNERFEHSLKCMTEEVKISVWGNALIGESTLAISEFAKEGEYIKQFEIRKDDAVVGKVLFQIGLVVFEGAKSNVGITDLPDEAEEDTEKWSVSSGSDGIADFPEEDVKHDEYLPFEIMREIKQKVDIFSNEKERRAYLANKSVESMR